MSSNALTEWKHAGLARLAELESIHAQLVGTAPGRRWGTTQLNRSLFVALVAQFQRYCRGLHDEAVQVHVAAVRSGQQPMLFTLLARGRKLEVQNPRRSALGSDFGRLGLDFIGALKARGPSTEQRLDALDLLIDYRNAVGHGDEAKIASLEADDVVRATKRSYQRYRRSLNGLAGTMDSVVAEHLAHTLGVGRPW